MSRLLTKCMADQTTAPFSGGTISAKLLDSGYGIRGPWDLILNDNPSEVYVGFFFTITDIAISNTVFMRFYDSVGAHLAYLDYNQVAEALILKSPSDVVLASTTLPIAMNTVYHMQIHIKGTATPIFQIKLDNIVALTYSASIGGSIRTIKTYSSGSGGCTAWFDAIIVNDVANPGDGTNMSWPGIRRLQIQTPTSDGTYTDWSKSDPGVAAYTLINNKPPNASEYIYSQTTGQKDSFGLSAHALPTLASVTGVIEQFYAYKNTEGQIKIGARVGGTDYMSGALSVGISGNIYQYVMAKNPSTGLAWVQGDLNSVEPVVESVI